MNKKVIRQSLSVCLLAGGVLAILLAGVWALEVRAQDESPICPPGFEWQRMSGVGCVQVDCYDAGGRLDYVSSCICNEGMKPCYELVNYDNFDTNLCGIHCPGSRLTACVAQDDLCPGEQAPVQEEPFFEPQRGDTPQFGSELIESAEHFILGGHAHPPTPGRSAAAAVTGTVMMGLYSLVQGLGQGAGKAASSMPGSGKSSMRQPVSQPSHKAGMEAPVRPVVPSPPAGPDLREAAGGFVNDISDVIDKWPEGGKGDEGVTVLRSAETDAGEEVFRGEDARLILIGMGKLPANTAQSEKMLIGEGGFAAFTGRHPGGEGQRIRLASGWEVLVSEITSVGYEGASPDQAGSVEIDFSRNLTLAARLAGDVLDAPTLRRSDIEDEEAPTVLRDDLDEKGEALS